MSATQSRSGCTPPPRSQAGKCACDQHAYLIVVATSVTRFQALVTQLWSLLASLVAHLPGVSGVAPLRPVKRSCQTQR